MDQGTPARRACSARESISYSLAGAVTDDRTVLHASTTGGAAEGAAALRAPGAPIKAGVCGFTTQRGWQVYLPLVVRSS
jgi:hypothetical protein